MIHFTDRPRVDVVQNEYLRLLGYPPGHTLTPRAVELAEAARAWYDLHGRPWIYAREHESTVLVAVSAGPELEAESQCLWRDEKPDEYFFLEIYGSAVVEHLISLARIRLRELAAPAQLAVLPHRSPGYADWDIADQPRLLATFGELPGPLEALTSGALRPRKSQLAVFPLTRELALAPAGELTNCDSCSLSPCQFRRPPQRPPHQVNLKALKRWAAERLALDRRPDGTIHAAFRYDGTTCSNMGHALAFDYRVVLGPPGEGHPILDQSCAPAPHDQGHTRMCRYLDSRDRLMDAIATEKPLAGQPLHEVLTWNRPTSPAACFCDPDSREHKWGLVLETIQYALDQSTPSSRD